MDILLLNPPARSKSPILLPPLGLAYLAASLIKSGYKVDILDAPALGMKLKDVLNNIRRRKPEILGIGGMTPNFDLTLDAIKSCRPFTRYLALGGPHASAFGKSLLTKIPEIDFLISGEGEKSFLQLVQVLDQDRDPISIAGISSQDGEGPPRTRIQDLDQLPFPARELLPNRSYRHPASPIASVATLITSRGCPYSCIFCDKSVFGNQARYRSPENVVNEIETIVGNLNIRELIFYDDIFLSPPDRAHAIAEEIIKRKLKIGFRCEGRVDRVDFGLLQTLKAAGCHTIAYGIESANTSGLEFLRKGSTPEEARRAIELTHRAGIKTGAYFILGIPVETREEMMKTIDFAVKLNPSFAQFSILSPTPGSELFRQARELKHLSSPKLNNPFDQDLARPYLESPHWTESELKRILKKAYMKFYLRPGFILRQMPGIIFKPSRLWQILKDLGSFGSWIWKQ